MQECMDVLSDACLIARSRITRVIRLIHNDSVLSGAPDFVRPEIDANQPPIRPLRSPRSLPPYSQQPDPPALSSRRRASGRAPRGALGSQRAARRA